MQSVARLVARSARSAAAAAEGYCSQRRFVGTAGCGDAKEKILKVSQGAATMTEPVAEDATRTAAQGQRFFRGYCVVVYGCLLAEVLRRFNGYHDEATAASSLELVGSITGDY
ncbi:hypothetical protein E2562_012584 [Oryza meyeriana var. granulata]|uniref:Uncharacterized protein n=1 Tax=Oryza meyeriana var. granulata TaxID=110450 RepID=A0A6G1D305_9ORYZ|nr:hypothetical protein E2562_012584 [Oryza meyeriana var. granulata]